MTKSNRIQFVLGMAIAVAILALPAAMASGAVVIPADPAECSADCQGPDCYGGCSISSTNCSVDCTHGNCVGTNAVCEEYGASNCDRKKVVTCVKIADPDEEPEEEEGEPAAAGSLQVRNSQWSVVSYNAHGPQAERSGLQVLATSNPDHAAAFVDELRGERQDVLASAAQRVGLVFDRGPALQRRVAYHVTPGTECVRADLEMSAPRFDASVPTGAAVFVRATVNAAGEVVAAQLLHADRTDGSEAAMIGHLKDFGHLMRADGQQAPFEAFIVLSAKPDGEASWIVSGSKLLF